MVKEWVVATDHVWLDGLGEFLAGSVSGEWREVVSPAIVGYVLHRRGEVDQAMPIARSISRFLLDERAEIWIGQLLRRRYHDFAREAQTTIIDTAVHSLHSDPERNSDRLNLATAELFRFLVDHDEVVLEGVCSFLWPEIAQEFAEAVDQAVDDFLLEKEYHDFVGLLRRLVTKAKHSIARAHVFFGEDRFYVEDEEGRRLGEDILNDMMSGIALESQTYDELLVSLLVTLAPNTVIIHRKMPDSEAMRTIQAVFGECMTCCRGCPRCLSGTWRIDNPERTGL